MFAFRKLQTPTEVGNKKSGVHPESGASLGTGVERGLHGGLPLHSRLLTLDLICQGGLLFLQGGEERQQLLLLEDRAALEPLTQSRPEQILLEVVFTIDVENYFSRQLVAVEEIETGHKVPLTDGLGAFLADVLRDTLACEEVGA